MAETTTATMTVDSTEQRVAAPTALQTPSPTLDTTIHTGGKDYLEPMVDLQTANFRNDPGIRFMLSSLSPARRESYLRTYMHVLLKAAMLNAGVFQQEGDWACGAVWLLPGKKVTMTLIPAGFVGCLFNLGIVGCKRMLIDFQSQSNAAKRAGLKGHKRYHYLFFMGTAEKARGRGLASHNIRVRQELAQKENLPMWLESTTERSRRVYEKCGFEVVHVMRLGVGTHDADGNEKKGGDGIRIWAMVWWPEALRQQAQKK